MSTPAKHSVVYVTSSEYKVEENRVFVEKVQLPTGEPVSSKIEFQIREVNIKEILEVDLRVMVQAEVSKAYSEIKVPCIVEHAGLVFADLEDKSYPGGLTKPMWNALGDRFVEETHSAGREAIARAVVAYCDGMSIHTFVGETRGVIADSPRGSRKFYWDTVFIPDDTTGDAAGKTYAEIVEHPDFGLEYKMRELSQSTRAMLSLVEFLQSAGQPRLWQGR